jgi:hypothetical protein
MLLRQFGALHSVQDAKHRTTVREQKGDLCDVDCTRRYIIKVVFHERLRKASQAFIEIDKTVVLCFMIDMLRKTR